MISLIVLGLAACVSGSLVTYPNGAQVPYDGANLAATHAHLASKGYYHGGLAYGGLVHHGGVHYIGKREAEADASLVTYANGAVVPYNPYLHGVGYGLYGHGGVHYLGKREAEADASLVTYSNGAVVPYNPYLHGVGYGLYGGVHYLGKREAEADASYLYAAPLAYGYPVVHHVGVPLVGHPNGAVVPAEPLSVVQARADHLAAKAALG